MPAYLPRARPDHPARPTGRRSPRLSCGLPACAAPGCSFPEPTSEEVAPGSVVYCNEVSDFARRAPHWRVYFLTHLRGEIGDALAFRETALDEFESSLDDSVGECFMR